MAQVSSVIIRERTAQVAEMSDAHCHLDLFSDIDGTVKKANSDGVGIIITSGGTVSGNVGAITATRHDSVFATIGIDPSAIEDYAYVEGMNDLIRSNSKIIGIGEVGLDSKYVEKYDLRMQKKAFEGQIDIAKELGLPVVVHSRGMMKEVIEVIEEYADVRFMMHFFEGTAEDAERLANAGNLVSIPVALNSNRKKVIKHLGIDNLVVETDSPVVGHSPSEVKGTIELISKMKSVSFYDVASMTTANLKRFFYI